MISIFVFEHKHKTVLLNFIAAQHITRVKPGRKSAIKSPVYTIQPVVKPVVKPV